MLRAVAAAGATLLPVDSEHNAIFQAMAEGNSDAVERIVLTASGGPFRTASLEEMARATPEAALRHPTWTMGAKISIDSATMFNKGLELIEAARLFAIPENRIGVLIHPQSVVHGIVHWRDGSMLAQLGSPDMRIPIAPRAGLAGSAGDVVAAARFGCTRANAVLRTPTWPAFPRYGSPAMPCGPAAADPPILSAANEGRGRRLPHASAGFYRHRGPSREAVLDRLGSPAADTLDDVMELDGAARRAAETIATAKAA